MSLPTEFAAKVKTEDFLAVHRFTKGLMGVDTRDEKPILEYSNSYRDIFLEDSLLGEVTCEQPVVKQETLSDDELEESIATIFQDDADLTNYELHSEVKIEEESFIGENDAHPLSQSSKANIANTESLVCESCDKYFTDSKQYKKHMRQHKNKKKTYACDICGKAYFAQCKLTDHLRLHSGERPFSCKFCDKTFVRASGLSSHSVIHSTDQPFACEHCDKTFARQAGLIKHLRTHTGQKPYSCSTCDRKFADSTTLRNHVRTHSGERPFLCKICDKRFSQLSALKLHLRSHSGDRPHACHLCDKRFSRPTDLTSHVRTHSGVRPFSCDICGVGITRKTHLQRHLKTHTGEKSWLCETCGKGFMRKSQLRDHMKTHVETHLKTGPRKKRKGKSDLTTEEDEVDVEAVSDSDGNSHSCKFCDKTFSDLDQLTSHLKIHAEGKPYTTKYGREVIETQTKPLKPKRKLMKIFVIENSVP